MNPIQKILGDNLRFYRQKQKLSQKTLAEKSDLSSNFIGQIERGIKFPSPDKIEAIARALGIESFKLFSPNPEQYDRSQPYIERYKKIIAEATRTMIREVESAGTGDPPKTNGSS
jgi:transcriptional regulator with XRE-family HTH domain